MKTNNSQSKKRTVQKTGHVFEKMNILKLFFENPEKDFHVREIARALRQSPSTISKLLTKLTKHETLISREEKKFKLFKSNTENKIYKETKLFYNILNIRQSGLIDYLINHYNHPSAIILFGSFRKAENIPSSDIDLFIQSSIKKESSLTEFENTLNHKIQLFVYSQKETELMKTKNKELLNNIINGIVLDGFLEVFT